MYAKRGMELNAARLRMATLPSPADEVLFTPDLWVPLVNLRGVFILPGIPKLFQAMVSAHQVYVLSGHPGFDLDPWSFRQMHGLLRESFSCLVHRIASWVPLSTQKPCIRILERVTLQIHSLKLLRQIRRSILFTDRWVITPAVQTDFTCRY